MLKCVLRRYHEHIEDTKCVLARLQQAMLAVAKCGVGCGSSQVAPQTGGTGHWCGRVWPCPSIDVHLVHGAAAWSTPLSLLLLSHWQPESPIAAITIDKSPITDFVTDGSVIRNKICSTLSFLLE